MEDEREKKRNDVEWKRVRQMGKWKLGELMEKAKQRSEGKGKKEILIEKKWKNFFKNSQKLNSNFKQYKIG